MPPLIFANAPFVAGAIVVMTLGLLVGFKLGVRETTLMILVLAALSSGLCSLLFSLNRKLVKQTAQVKQAQLMADRLQAMVGATPGGYCLFTPHGLVREVVRVTSILGVEKITHTDDIIGALKDAPAFIDGFRRLQQMGDGFSVAVHTMKSGKAVQVTGRRFRAGREGPVIDVLWFSDEPLPTTAPQPVVDDKIVEISRQELLQVIVDKFPFPVWARNADLALILCNTAYAKSLDLTPDAVIRDQNELTSRNARGGSGRALASDALASRQTQSGRRHVIVAGNRHLLAINEIPLGADDGGLGLGFALLGFALDVTAEEEKDAALQRHIEAEHEVLENLGTAIAIYGADMRLEFYNRSYQRLWAAEESFLNGKPDFGEILEDLRERRRAPEQSDFQRYKRERLALFTSLLEPREDLMHLPDGTSLRIIATPHPLGGLMFVHEDVTDKLALESSYNTLIAVQRETLDNLAEGIVVFGPDGKLRLFNPAYARIWKLSPEYLAGSPHIAELLEHVKPLLKYDSSWASFKNEMVEYTLDRNPRSGRIERADNAIIQYNSVPLPDGAVLNSYLDVTDSVKVEQALRASNTALAAADRLKSEFVANVSYQLRTPLNTIMGFAEILTNQYFGSLNDRQIEYTRTIMEASKKLLLLINDVLDLATIEAGRMTLEYRTIDVADLLNAVKTMSVEWARQQSLEMTIDCPSNIGSFEADEQRIKQTLFNLISNAVKYTSAGGRITLMANKTTEWMALSVIDTGIGIPEADRERVFGKFERANSHIRQSGAGLGLSLVKSFVELHGGRIEIGSEVNQGTRVTCYLPLVAVKPAANTFPPQIASS